MGIVCRGENSDKQPTEAPSSNLLSARRLVRRTPSSRGGGGISVARWSLMPLASDTATGVQRVDCWQQQKNLTTTLSWTRGIGSVQFMFAATSDDGQFGIYVGTKLGIQPETARLALLAVLFILVWTHGRALLRVISILLLSLTVTCWACLRKLHRALFQSSRRRPTRAAPARTPSGYTLPPLPAIASSKLSAALHEIIRLHEEECDVFGAVQLLDALEAGLSRTSAGSALTAELASAAPTLREVRARHAATLEALHLFDSDEGWAGSFEMLGSTTSFRRSTVGGGMTVRVDGVIEGVPASDLLAVWREVAHFSDWLPSCSSSRLLRMKGRVELLLHMHINVLNLLTRDAVVHGFGVDCLSTAGRMLIMGKSVTAEEMPADRNVIPEEPEWPLVRMEYRKLQVALEPLSPTTTRAPHDRCRREAPLPSANERRVGAQAHARRHLHAAYECGAEDRPARRAALSSRASGPRVL